MKHVLWMTIGAAVLGVALSAARAQEAAKAGATREIKTADELLTALERADADLRTLKADVWWDQTFALAGDRQGRLGTLVFVVKPAASEGEPPERRFAVDFTELHIGARKESNHVSYVFDGEWLLEKRHDEKPKTFSRMQMAPPGVKIDPMSVGEGFMPLPIGQKKQEILSRYSAELLPGAAGLDPKLDAKLIEFATGCYQLRLRPLPHLEGDAKFLDVRLWYRAEPKLPGSPLLPRMAKTENSERNVSVVQLINVKVNEEVDAKVIDTSAPGAGWNGKSEPYRGKAEPAPAVLESTTQGR